MPVEGMSSLEEVETDGYGYILEVSLDYPLTLWKIFDCTHQTCHDLLMMTSVIFSQTAHTHLFPHSTTRPGIPADRYGAACTTPIGAGRISAQRPQALRALLIIAGVSRDISSATATS